MINILAITTNKGGNYHRIQTTLAELNKEEFNVVFTDSIPTEDLFLNVNIVCTS